MKYLYLFFILIFPFLLFGQADDGPTTQIYSQGNYYKAIALADYNGDGVADVWSANSSNNHIEIWTYSTEKDSLVLVNEITGLSSPSNYIHDLAVADLDNDGDMDAVATLRNAGSFLCINNGDSSWTVSKLDDSYGWQVIIADYNMDQSLDILLATDWSYLKIYYGDGLGGFTQGIAPQSAFKYGDSKGMNAVDVDNDGDPDIVGISAEWTNSGTNRYIMRAYQNDLSAATPSWGSFNVLQDSLTMLPSYVKSSNNSAGDVNGDGYIDQVCFTSDNDILIFYGASDQSGFYFQKADTLLKSFHSAFSSVSLIDLDDDSDLDIFAFGYDNFDGLLLFKNDGNGNLDSNYIPLGAGLGNFHSVKGGDIDGNGTTDIIGARYDLVSSSDDGFQVFFFPKQKEQSDSIIYVNQSADGRYDGSSWQNAYICLQDALLNARPGTQIWVAGGIYRPDDYCGGEKTISVNDPRDVAFNIPDSVSIYGGFSGFETNIDERSGQDTTILSGDIGTETDPTDNTYHVIITGGNNIIDGIVISDGYADGSEAPDNTGGGIYNSADNIVVANCIIRDNYAKGGGGITNTRVGKPTNNIEIRNSAFINNKADEGAGIGNWDAPTSIDHCVFAADSATGMGGAVYNWGANSDAYITHCTFYANAAGDSALGGAVHSRASGIYTDIINCIFWDNSSDIGYGSETHGSVTRVYYSDLQQTDYIQGSDNISEDPMFIDSPSFNFSLTEGSPCIDAGTELLVIGSDTLFIGDSSSYKGNAPDMGAFESDYTTAVNEKLANIPQNFKLMQNYPNPFNPTTTIRYMLAENAHVVLSVYDVQGRKVRTLIDNRQKAGSHTIQFNASNLASGIYIYEIKAGSYTQMKKMILVR